MSLKQRLRKLKEAENKMRTFEEDFGFDSDYFKDEARAVSTQGIRKDSHKTVTRDPNRTGDPEHDARLAVHTERIRKVLGIK